MIWSLVKTMFRNFSVKTNKKLYDVRIANITLDTVSNYSRSKSRNPHTLRAKSANRKQTSINGQTIKTGSLKVTLNLCVKVQDPFKFINRREAVDIKIAVLQVTNPEFRKKVSDDPVRFMPTQTQEIDSRFIKTKILSLDNSIPFNNAVYASSKLRASANGSTVTNFDADIKVPFTANIDANGNTYYDIPINATFIIEEEEGGASVEDLSYFCYSFVDRVEEFDNQKTDFRSVSSRLRLDSLDRLLSIGRVHSEIVIKNGKLQSKTNVFRDQGGAFWTGPVHRMDNGVFMKGISHKKNPVASDYLTRSVIENPKIKDFRIARAILQADVFGNITAQPNEYTIQDARIIDEKRRDRSIGTITKQNTIFSNIYLSRDKENAVRFMFSFNLEEAIKQNSDYSGLLSKLKVTNPAVYSRLIKGARIEDLSITRNKVLLSNPDSREFFGLNRQFPVEKMVASAVRDANATRDLASTNLTVAPRNETSLETEKKVVGSIREITNVRSSDSLEIKHFSGVDIGIASEDAGSYQYTATVSLSTTIEQFLQATISSMDALLGDGDFGDNDLSLTSYQIDAASNKLYVDKYMDRFRPEFMRYYNSKYVVSGRSFVLEAARKYVSIFFTFINSKSFPYTPVEVTNFLTTIASPNTGNPMGIALLKAMIYQLRYQLKRAINSSKKYSKYRGTGDFTTNRGTNVGASNPIKRTTLQNTFKEIYNCDTPKGVGFDYLYLASDKADSSQTSLTSVTRKYLMNRFDAEVSKFFTSQNVKDISIRNDRGEILNPGDNLDNTKYSYLSPSNIFTNDTERNNSFVNTNCEITSQDNRSVNETMSRVITYNSKRSQDRTTATANPTKVDPTERSKLSLASETLSGRGVSFEEPERTQQKIRDENTNDKPASSFLGPTADFNLKVIDDGQDLFNDSKEYGTSTQKERVKLSETDVSGIVDLMLKVDSGGLLDKCNSLENYFFRDGTGAQNYVSKLVDAMCSTSPTGRNGTQTPLNRAPIHLKALLLGVNGSDSVKTSNLFNGIASTLDESSDIFKDPERQGVLQYNYRSLKEVQVFKGFKSDGSKKFMKDPIWVPLSKNDLDSLGDQNLVCRIVDTQDSRECIDTNSNLSLPPFNDVFIVSGDSARSTTSIGGNYVFDTPFNFTKGALSSKFLDDTKAVTNFIDQKKLFTDTLNCKSNDEIKTEFMTSNLLTSENGGVQLSSEPEKTGKEIDTTSTATFKILDEIVNAGFADMLPEKMRNTSQARSNQMGTSQQQKLVSGTTTPTPPGSFTTGGQTGGSSGGGGGYGG